MRTSRYFGDTVFAKRPYLKVEWCLAVLANPIRREVPDGRIRLWGRIEAFGNRVLRAVTLEGGETLYNVS